MDTPPPPEGHELGPVVWEGGLHRSAGVTAQPLVHALATAFPWGFGATAVIRSWRALPRFSAVRVDVLPSDAEADRGVRFTVATITGVGALVAGGRARISAPAYGLPYLPEPHATGCPGGLHPALVAALGSGVRAVLYQEVAPRFPLLHPDHPLRQLARRLADAAGVRELPPDEVDQWPGWPAPATNVWG